ASKAEIDHDSWHFPDAASTTFSEEKISKTPKKADEIPIVIDNQALTALTSAPESLSAQKLWEFIRYLDRNGLDSSEHRLAFWSKIFHPLTNISMILIAAPLVFAQQRQKGIGERILIGVVLGLCIYLATQMLGHFILIAGFAPIIGALIPTLLAITIAFVLFRLVPN
ncbi:MAG: LptF/LptG family permease, partial [Xanthomonadaceae bacterium]|nr:LptF/LptG family permease [Xanthomonadaceae bacterium]